MELFVSVSGFVRLYLQWFCFDLSSLRMYVCRCFWSLRKASGSTLTGPKQTLCYSQGAEALKHNKLKALWESLGQGDQLMSS
jgi:hypothetical protein